MATVSNNPQPYDDYSIGSQNADGKKTTDKKGTDSGDQLKELLEKILRTYEKGKQDLWAKILEATSDSNKELLQQLQKDPGSSPSVPDVSRDGTEMTKDIQNFFMLIYKFLSDHKEGESKMEISQAVNTQGKEILLNSVTKATLDSVANMKSQIEDAYKKAHSPLATFLKIGLPIIIAVITIVCAVAAVFTAGGSVGAAAAADSALVSADAAATTAGTAAAGACEAGTTATTAATAAIGEGAVEGGAAASANCQLASYAASVAETQATIAENAATEAETFAETAGNAAKTGGEDAQALADAAKQSATAARTAANAARTAADAAKAASQAADAVANGTMDASEASTIISESSAQITEASSDATQAANNAAAQNGKTLEGVVRGTTKFARFSATKGFFASAKVAGSCLGSPTMIAGIGAGASMTAATTSANQIQADQTNSVNSSTQTEQGEVAVNSSASQALQTDISANMQYQQNEMNEQQADDSQTQTILQSQATMYTIGSFNA